MSLIAKAAGFFQAAPLGVDADIILNHYRTVTPKPLKPFTLPEGAVLSSVCTGLGDSMMLTDLPRASRGDHQSFSPSEHFRWLMRRNPHWKEVEDKHFLINAPDLVRQYDCGNGHYLQRIRRAFGCKVDDKPRGCIVWKGTRHTNRVILHFDAGVHALWQRREIHPQARIISPQTRIEITKFIERNKNLEFVEVGKNPLRLKGTRHIKTDNTGELIETIAQAAWFLGIISGPMHVATALELKCVVILNFPSPDSIFLPTMVVTDQVESEWLAPQNVHLSQEGDGPLVKKSTADNIQRAFDGALYPYWSDSYLHLIHEKL